MNQIISHRGKPKQIFVRKGGSCVSKAMDKWAYAKNIVLIFSSPGKLTGNVIFNP